MNSLREKNKNKSILITQLKLNKKSIAILESLNLKTNFNKYKSISSRNKKYSLNSNLFSDKQYNLKLIKKNLTDDIDKQKINSQNIKSNLNPKSLTERNYNNFIIEKSKIKNFKSRNRSNINNNEINFPSINLSAQNSKKLYTMNINKYKNIFDTVFSRIKSSYKKKKKTSNFRNIINMNVNKRKYSSPLINKTKTSLYKNFNNDKFHSIPKLEDYENTMENEFNYKELLKLENIKINQKLNTFKSNIYNKTPLYKTNEKLNTLLIRQFNLDESDFKKSFNKKYKIYKASINKIIETRNKNLFHEDSNSYDYKKLNINQGIYGYFDKNKKITNKNVKIALNKYYNQKTKKILSKKLELERELIDLKTKFKDNIEKEKYIKNEFNINYGQLNQLIQEKLIYKEVYETDINKKKKHFYEEHTKMIHKIRKWSVPSKVVKLFLKQKTINKFKTNIGAYFGSS